jgi:DNA repair photolyase
LKIIYETHGRAREYFELAANLYLGCSHACVYCYGPDVLHSTPGSFFKDPRPRKNVLAQLESDAAELRLKSETRPILLSFVTDPYQPIDDKYHLTRQAIAILKTAGLSVAILTKGGRRATDDLDLLGPGDQFGTTLTLVDEVELKKWEPGAAPFNHRLGSLGAAKSMGLRTFVSLEPIINLADTLEIIRRYYFLVDFWKVGKLNYHEHAKEVDWRNVAQEIVAALDNVRASYYIKKDLGQYINKPEGILHGK